MKNVVITSAVCLLIMNACKLTNKESSDTTEATADSSAVMKDSGWVSLTDLSRWHTYGKDSVGSAWKMDNGAIHLDASQKGDWQSKNGGDIVSDEEYENFDLQLDWKISEAGNSGIIFLINEDTSKYPYVWHTGPEMQVADNDKNEDGKIFKHQAGDLYDLFPTNSDSHVKPAGVWNHVEISVNNGKLDLFMNGYHSLDTTIFNDGWKNTIAGSKFKDMPDFGTFKSGKIALQDHGADVWFRNIRIRRL